MEGIIRVNVPKTEAFYRFLCSAFFTQPKAVYNRMLKALKADAETASENAETVLRWYDDHFDELTPYKGFLDRKKELYAIASETEKNLSAEEKRTVKTVLSFCAGKKSPNEIIKNPFLRDGCVYATDSYVGIRIEDVSAYKGNYQTEGNFPAMEKIFSAFVPSAYETVKIPSLDVLKSWQKTANNFSQDKTAFCVLRNGENKIVLLLEHLIKAVSATGSDTVYISAGTGKTVYMISESGKLMCTCVILAVINPSQYASAPECDNSIFVKCADGTILHHDFSELNAVSETVTETESAVLTDKECVNDTICCVSVPEAVPASAPISEESEEQKETRTDIKAETAPKSQKKTVSASISEMIRCYKGISVTCIPVSCNALKNTAPPGTQKNVISVHLPFT